MKKQIVEDGQIGIELNGKKSLWARIKKYKIFYLFLLPAVIWYILYYYVPIYGLVIAFKDFKIADGILGSEWVGFKHFKRMFNTPDFWQILKNTIWISFLKMTIVFGSGVVMALLLNEIKPKHTRFKKTVQSISYLPHFFSWVIIASIMTALLSPSSGVVNEIIVHFGGEPIYFLADQDKFVSILILSDIWQSCGWGSIVFLAAISGIDTQLYEAATVDGANRFRKNVAYYDAGIMSVLVIMMIMNLGGILNGGFNQIFNLYNPRVYKVADILDTYVYRVGLEQMQYSYSTAVGLFKNVVGLILVAAANKVADLVGQQGLW